MKVPKVLESRNTRIRAFKILQNYKISKTIGHYFFILRILEI